MTDTRALDCLRADLLNISPPCAFTTIVDPCYKRALHDHTYSKLRKDDNSAEPVYNLIPISPPQHNELKERCTIVKRNLQVSSEARKDIEQATRLQAECLLWHQVRQQRITGSKCGQILG